MHFSVFCIVRIGSASGIFLIGFLSREAAVLGLFRGEIGILRFCIGIGTARNIALTPLLPW